MSVDTQWFKDRLAEKRLSQRGLAKMLDLDAAAISLTLRGRREMKLSEAASIAMLLGTPVEEVLAHAGVRTNSDGARINVSAVIDEHQEVVAIPPSESFEVAVPPGLPANCMAIQCRTTGTPMAYKDGWIFFTRTPENVSADAVGRFSYVRMKNGLATLAQVARGYRPGRYNLSGPASAENVELDFAEPVLLIQP